MPWLFICFLAAATRCTYGGEPSDSTTYKVRSHKKPPAIRGKVLPACTVISRAQPDEDISGWHCADKTAVFCDCWHSCEPTDDEDEDSDMERCHWECNKELEERCTVGSPPCVLGKCKTQDQACGTSWAVNPRARTCQHVFSSESQATRKLVSQSQATYLADCLKIFGSQPICPATMLPYGYISWADKTSTVVAVDRMLAAAAIDTIWLYNTLGANRSNDTVQIVNVAHKFSCQRNVPECVADQPSPTNCETSCKQINAAINQKCGALAPTNGTSLGFVRDCHGRHTAAAGDCPGLCMAFQNTPISLTGNAVGMGASHTTLMISLMVVWRVAVAF